jgi:L-lactate dehydrogenase (cytochrome)
MQVDSAGIGKRERDLRLTPGGSAPRSKATRRRWADDLTWDDIPWFRSFTKTKIVLKGVQSAADAIMAYEKGLDGIVCSNHGGRNMDGARPALEVLIEVIAALKQRKYDPRKFEVCVEMSMWLECSECCAVHTCQHACRAYEVRCH